MCQKQSALYYTVLLQLSHMRQQVHKLKHVQTICWLFVVTRLFYPSVNFVEALPQQSWFTCHHVVKAVC